MTMHLLALLFLRALDLTGYAPVSAFRNCSRSATKCWGDRCEFFLIEANRFRLFQSVAGEIADYEFVGTESLRPPGVSERRQPKLQPRVQRKFPRALPSDFALQEFPRRSTATAVPFDSRSAASARQPKDTGFPT